MFLDSLVRREPICIIFVYRILKKIAPSHLEVTSSPHQKKNVTTVRCNPDLMHLTNVAFLS